MEKSKVTLLPNFISQEIGIVPYLDNLIPIAENEDVSFFGVSDFILGFGNPLPKRGNTLCGIYRFSHKEGYCLFLPTYDNALGKGNSFYNMSYRFWGEFESYDAALLRLEMVSFLWGWGGLKSLEYLREVWGLPLMPKGITYARNEGYYKVKIKVDDNKYYFGIFEDVASGIAAVDGGRTLIEGYLKMNWSFDEIDLEIERVYKKNRNAVTGGTIRDKDKLDKNGGFDGLVLGVAFPKFGSLKPKKEQLSFSFTDAFMLPKSMDLGIESRLGRLDDPLILKEGSNLPLVALFATYNSFVGVFVTDDPDGLLGQMSRFSPHLINRLYVVGLSDCVDLSVFWDSLLPFAYEGRKGWYDLGDKATDFETFLSATDLSVYKGDAKAFLHKLLGFILT